MARKTFKQWLRALFVGPIGYLDYYNPNNIDYGVTVTHDTALRFTAVYAAIKLLAENIAALPKSVKKDTEQGFISEWSHPVYKLLADSPNGYTDSYAFWFMTIANLNGYGNAYALIEWDERGYPRALHQLHPDYVMIGFDRGEKVYKVRHPLPQFRFLNGVYEDWQMLHFMLYTYDGIKGIDPIAYNASAIGRGIAAQSFSADYYKKGGQIKGVLETDNSLDDETYDSWMKHYRASANNFETPLLEYGIKYKQIGITPIAAQLIQSETLSIQDIARTFNVPPHLLAELSHATFSNIEQQNIFFGKYSLRPITKRLEVQLERKLFLPREREQYSVKFDLRGLMRGDDAARATYYTQGINAGWLTRNEARDLEEMVRLEGLDVPLQPLNMVEAGTQLTTDDDNDDDNNNDNNA